MAPTRGNRVRGAIALALGAALAVAFAAVVPTAPPAAASGGGAAARYVVRAEAGRLTSVLALLRADEVTPVSVLASVDSVVAALSPAEVDRLRRSADVAEVTADASVQLLSDSYDPSSDADSMASIAGLLRADDAWDAGATGAGVDVALVDSGVTPVEGLAAPGQVVNGPDLSFESQSTGTRFLDTFGHGTFMAGLIAGHDPDGTPDAYRGIAPGARLVSIKVADAQGRTDVSQVIAAIDWVVQHAHLDGLNIRVLNLSFGTDSTQSYLLDPLAYAAEVAWHHGIVVVASSGNHSGSTLADPAVDPYVVAVGALDTQATVTARDDRVASFTAVGNRERRVDLLAPGVHVQGLRVPGSYVDLRYGSTARVGTRFLRGSGTSQAAALTSGVVALMLQQRPHLTPDQVKHLLVSTDRAVRQDHGWFSVGVPNALRATFGGWAGPADQQGFPPATGTGSLQDSRGSVLVSQGGSSLVGEQDILGDAVDTAALARLEADGASWTGASWNGASWDGASWDGASWTGASWDGASWDGASWDGASWDGASWDGASWDAAGWLGVAWR